MKLIIEEDDYIIEGMKKIKEHILKFRKTKWYLTEINTNGYVFEPIKCKEFTEIRVLMYRHLYPESFPGEMRPRNEYVFEIMDNKGHYQKIQGIDGCKYPSFYDDSIELLYKFMNKYYGFNLKYKCKKDDSFQNESESEVVQYNLFD